MLPAPMIAMLNGSSVQSAFSLDPTLGHRVGLPDIKDTPVRELIGDIEHLGYEASHFEGINKVMGGRGGRKEAVWVSFK